MNPVIYGRRGGCHPMSISATVESPQVAGLVAGSGYSITSALPYRRPSPPQRQVATSGMSDSHVEGERYAPPGVARPSARRAGPRAETAEVMTSFFRGDEDAVRTALWELHAQGDHFVGAGHERDVLAGLDALDEGEWLIKVPGGWTFEIVETPQSVEQDVYGCAKGRSCGKATAEQREKFDAIIESRLAQGEAEPAGWQPHWVQRLDRRTYGSWRVREFVTETMGVELIADIAVMLADNAAQHTHTDNIDVHLTRFPDRIRVRVDDAGDRGKTPGPHVLPRDLDGKQRGSLAFVAQKAIRWSLCGSDAGWSVWADLAYRSGGRKIQGVEQVKGRTIPIGFYVYWAEQLCWVKVKDRYTGFKGITVVELEGFCDSVEFKADTLVPVYSPIGGR